jgi:predicted ATPase
MPIDRIYIKNFKSIRECEVKITPINILIGPNGAGKSNFIQFFKLLNSIYRRRLNLYVAENGYEDQILYFGRKHSQSLEGSIVFKPEENANTNNLYKFKLVPKTSKSGFYFEEDIAGYNIYALGYGESWDYRELGGAGYEESELMFNELTRSGFLRRYFEEFTVFHFHDTSPNSPLKQANKIEDCKHLREYGGNLAAFLYNIQQTHLEHFRLIEFTIRSIAPFFDRFDLKPDPKNPDMIFLNWLEKTSDDYFNAHNLSDGTLRFIALATLFLQPNPPKTIIIDEPELGLHPFALKKLSGLIKSASTRSQVIVSTQSVYLLDQFSANDVIVLERHNGQTVFNRQNEENLKEWLNEYSLGELWEKNILGGRPK